MFYKEEECGDYYPKPVVPVPVMRVVPVAVGAPGVVLSIVERAAPQHAVSLWVYPSQTKTEVFVDA